jgi:hypothetical protein
MLLSMRDPLEKVAEKVPFLTRMAGCNLPYAASSHIHPASGGFKEAS